MGDGVLLMRPWVREDEPKRLVRAFAAGVATSVAVYVLVIRLALPALVARLSTEEVDGLRRAFRSHPYAIIFGIFIVAAILALPVLVAFRIAYGPLRPVGIRRGHS